MDDVTIILSLLKIRCPLLTSCCLFKLTALPILRPRPARFQKSDIKIRYPWPLPCCTVVQYFCIAKSWCNYNQTILCQGGGSRLLGSIEGLARQVFLLRGSPNRQDWKDYQVDCITLILSPDLCTLRFMGKVSFTIKTLFKVTEKT